MYDQVEGFKCDRASSNYSPTKTSRPTDTHSLIEVNQWALESLTSIARDKLKNLQVHKLKNDPKHRVQPAAFSNSF